MAGAQNFGAERIIKQGSNGSSLSWLVTTSNTSLSDRALLVEVVSMPPVTVGDVSVIQQTNPWVVAGDVSTTIAFPASAQVFVNNTSLNPLPVAIQGNVSVVILTSPLTVQGLVSVTGDVSVKSPVSVTGEVSVKNTVSVVQAVGASFQIQGAVSVQNFPTVTSVTGEVSVKNTVSISPAVGTSFHVEGNVSAAIVGTVSVTGQVSVLGPVSVTGQVSVLGNVSTHNDRTAFVPLSPARVSVANTTCLALAANTSRTGCVITNANLTSIGGIPVYLGLATVAVLGSGIVLYPGGTWSMDEFTFTTACITAIASAAGTASLSLQEFNRT